MRTPPSYVVTRALHWCSLAPHRHDYANLLAQLEGGYFPCCDPEWIEAFESLYARRGAEMYFLLVWADSKLVGVAPFHRHVRLPWLARGFRCLTFYGQDSGSILLENTIGRLLLLSAHRDTATEAIARYLLTEGRGDWESLDLRMLAADSPDTRALTAALVEARSTDEGYSSYGVNAQLPWPVVLATFNKQELRNLRRRQAKLTQEGHTSRLYCLTTLTTEQLAVIAALHSDRQDEISQQRESAGREKLFAGRLANAVKAVMSQLASAGRLRLYIYEVDDELAAFQVVISHRGEALLWFNGFNTSYASYSPANHLLLAVYQQEIEIYQVDYLNLLPGETRPKQAFSNTQHANLRLRLPNCNHWLARSKLWALERLLRVATRMKRVRLPVRLNRMWG